MSNKMERVSNYVIEQYDRQSNVCYFSIHPMIDEKGFMSSKKSYDYTQVINIAVYDISSQTTNYLFESVNEGDLIIDFVFEEYFDEKQESILFNDISRRSEVSIRNNEHIPKRDLANRIWVLQNIGSKSVNRLWSFDKSGHNKQLVAEFSKNTKCRIDVFNQKIRLIKYKSDKLEIQDFEYFDKNVSK